MASITTSGGPLDSSSPPPAFPLAVTGDDDNDDDDGTPPTTASPSCSSRLSPSSCQTYPASAPAAALAGVCDGGGGRGGATPANSGVRRSWKSGTRIWTLDPRRLRMLRTRAAKRGCGLMHASGMASEREMGPCVGGVGGVLWVCVCGGMDKQNVRARVCM
jgi:hypothetical protein